MQKKIFGITGGSGVGKSYVSDLFKQTPNTHIINVDKLGHTVLENEAKKEILDHFGTTNRKELGKIVFSDPVQLQKLNKITHKHITQKVYTEVSAKQNSAIIVIDAAVLVDLNLHLICDIVILVKATKATRIKRIMQRDNITKDQAKKRIASQNIFVPQADIVIYNG